MMSNPNYYSDASSDDSGEGDYSANNLPAHMLEPPLEQLDLSVYYKSSHLLGGGGGDVHGSYSDMEDDDDEEENLASEHTDDLAALYAATSAGERQYPVKVSEGAPAMTTLVSPPFTSSDYQEKEGSNATTQQSASKVPFLSKPLAISSTNPLPVERKGLQGSQPISVINPPLLFRGGEEFAKSQSSVDAIDNKDTADFASSSAHNSKAKANSTLDAYYSDMSDEDGGDGNGDEHLLSVSQDSNTPPHGGGNVNYAALFPEAESEMRSAMFIRNSRLEVKKEELIGGRNQDYLQLAKIYSEQRQYADEMQHPACVLCNQNICSHVFFPCEHRCVCAACIEKGNFCEDKDMLHRSDGYNMCPLCATVIKKILPFEAGLEVTKYWEWVEEVSPPLPPGFKRKFKRSEDVLHRVYVEKDPLSSIEDSFCKPS